MLMALNLSWQILCSSLKPYLCHTFFRLVLESVLESVLCAFADTCLRHRQKNVIANAPCERWENSQNLIFLIACFVVAVVEFPITRKTFEVIFKSIHAVGQRQLVHLLRKLLLLTATSKASSFKPTWLTGAQVECVSPRPPPVPNSPPPGDFGVSPCPPLVPDSPPPGDFGGNMWSSKGYAKTRIPHVLLNKCL